MEKSLCEEIMGFQMYIIRSIELKDENCLCKLAEMAPPGMLSLPKNLERLKIKLNESIASFSDENMNDSDKKYIFILENSLTGSIDGCSAIQSSAGPFGSEYYYKIKTIEQVDRPIEQIPKEQKILIPTVSPIENTSELCSLFLSPSCQKQGIGRLLSMSRFLFMKCFPERFQKHVIAELRGVIDKTGHSPIWQALGRHFCDIDLEDFITMLEEKTLSLEHVLARFPIYATFLQDSVQDHLGETNPHSKPALQMLLKEGFTYLDGVDITDGGPKVIANLSDIRIVKEAELATVSEVVDLPHDEMVPVQVISNTSLQFRACFGRVEKSADNDLCIDEATAKALQVSAGDTICFANAKV